MTNIDKKLSDYTSFGVDIAEDFEEISAGFERLVTSAEAEEYQNPQSVRFRIIYRDMTVFAKHCSASLRVLKEELDSKLEFA